MTPPDLLRTAAKAQLAALMGPSLVETLQIEVTDQGTATYQFQLEEHLQETQQHRLVPGVPAVPGEPLSESASPSCLRRLCHLPSRPTCWS